METLAEMFAGSPIQVGQSYRFDYPVEFESLPEYSARRGALVTVTGPDADSDVIWDDPDGTGERIVDRMFRVRAEDGWVGSAWESELVSP
jgi:hypothetical protein